VAYPIRSKKKVIVGKPQLALTGRLEKITDRRIKKNNYKIIL